MLAMEPDCSKALDQKDMNKKWLVYIFAHFVGFSLIYFYICLFQGFLTLLCNLAR